MWPSVPSTLVNRRATSCLRPCVSLSSPQAAVKLLPILQNAVVGPMTWKTVISQEGRYGPIMTAAAVTLGTPLGMAFVVVVSLFVSSLHARADISQRWSDQLWNIVGG